MRTRHTTLQIAAISAPARMAEMLETIEAESLDAFVDAIVPADIRQTRPLAWGKALSERGVLDWRRSHERVL
ncbi:hypothetical protein [Chelativorans multitrophicus]|nr:hypothetical protein [Chelativorans multitrophicus]